MLKCTAKECSVEGITLKQIAGSKGQESDGLEVCQGGSCSMRLVSMSSETGSGLCVSGGSCKLDSCRIHSCAKHGLVVKEGGSATAKETAVSGNGAAGVVSRGKGSKVGGNRP
jgi:hypothetical protein